MTTAIRPLNAKYKALLCIRLRIRPARLAPVHNNAFLLEDIMDMVLKYQDGEVRTVNRDGQIWFVLTDIIGLSNPTMAAKVLDDDERSKSDLGRQGEAVVINEFGLYSLILRSDKPEAKQFKRWVTHDVLPSIRKHGFYVDQSWTMHTSEIANLFLHSHTEVMKMVGNVLPQYWYQCNSILRKQGLRLNALEAFLVIAKACRDGLHNYEMALPEPVRKIAIGMGVQFKINYQDYIKSIGGKK
jgi:prophage antirepressor-like protein